MKKLKIFIIVFVLGIAGIIFIIGNQNSWGKQNMKNTNQESIILNESNYSDDVQFNLDTRMVTLNNGDKMPLNGIGTYSLVGEECYRAIRSALDLGVRLIDTAYMYHNEEEVGRAIRDSNVPREEIFVITKIYPSQFNDPKSANEMA